MQRCEGREDSPQRRRFPRRRTRLVFVGFSSIIINIIVVVIIFRYLAVNDTGSQCGARGSKTPNDRAYRGVVSI